MGGVLGGSEEGKAALFSKLYIYVSGLFILLLTVVSPKSTARRLGHGSRSIKSEYVCG